MPEPDYSMGYLMHWSARLFRRLADRRLKPLGLSSGHLPVINALMAAEAMSQKALVEVAAIEQPTMAATLARMERDGLIDRRPDPADRRSALFSLSPATRGKVGAIREAIAGMNEAALRGLSPADRPHFRQQLITMITALEKQLDDEQ